MDYSVIEHNGLQYVFDSWRKRRVRLTPEESVRQQMLGFLVEEKGYPHGRIAVEHTVEINGMKKRCDAVVYDQNAKPLMIIEFKAQDVALTQKVFDQAAVYNTKLQVPYLMVSNGIQTHVCKIGDDTYIFAREIPRYEELVVRENCKQ